MKVLCIVWQKTMTSTPCMLLTTIVLFPRQEKALPIGREKQAKTAVITQGNPSSFEKW